MDSFHKICFIIYKDLENFFCFFPNPKGVKKETQNPFLATDFI
jgi:hypothetical protein